MVILCKKKNYIVIYSAYLKTINTHQISTNATYLCISLTNGPSYKMYIELEIIYIEQYVQNVQIYNILRYIIRLQTEEGALMYM